MTTPKTKLHELLDDLRAIQDRDERMEFLIDLAEKFKGVPESIAARPYPESARVPACQSDAFIFAEKNPDKTLTFHIAVENPQGISAKAMASVLDTLSGAPLEEVLSTPTDIVYELFGRDIGMGKGQGLMGMLHMVQALAKQARLLLRAPS